MFWLICSDNAKGGFFISRKNYKSWSEVEAEYKNTIYSISYPLLSELTTFLVEDGIISEKQARKTSNLFKNSDLEVIDIIDIMEDRNEPTSENKLKLC